MQTLNYHSISPKQWQQLITIIEDKFALVIDADTGSNSNKGWAFHWCYNPAEQSLNLQCTKKPMLVPFSFIKETIDKLIRQVLF